MREFRLKGILGQQGWGPRGLRMSPDDRFAPTAKGDGASRPTLRGHLEILRANHWFKNVFVLPGVVVALGLDPVRADAGLPWRLLAGLAAVCLVASSNYVLNEIMDAPYDRHHPFKASRPVSSGRVSIPIAYVQWVILMAAALALGWAAISTLFAGVLASLWIMGWFYNVPPIRTKEVPYLDVLSEAINNPLRMLAGWYLTGTALVPPASLLISYWMVGCYFMAIKRYAELKTIGDTDRAAAYRKSFGHYNEQNLIVSITFYGTTAMLFFGAFLMRYRLELVLSFPLVAMVMARYLSLAFKPDSPVQHPEDLYREPSLMVWVVLCTLAVTVLLFADVPLLHQMFPATEPVIP